VSEGVRITTRKGPLWPNPLLATIADRSKTRKDRLDWHADHRRRRGFGTGRRREEPPADASGRVSLSTSSLGSRMSVVNKTEYSLEDLRARSSSCNL
jgi:hypothetical protein